MTSRRVDYRDGERGETLSDVDGRLEQLPPDDPARESDTPADTSTPADTNTPTDVGDQAGSSDAAGGDGPGRVRRAVGWVITGLAFLLVLFALISPDRLSGFTPGAFVRVPLEGIVGVALLLVLPRRAGQVVAALGGAMLGLLTIVKIADLGFFASLDRPFDLVLDWPLFGDAVEFLTTSIGRAGAIGAVIAAVLLAVAVPVLMTLSALRLTRLVLQHRSTATGGVAVLGVVWVTCAALGAQIVPGAPVAADSAATLSYDRAVQVRAGLQDEKAFAAEVGVDAFKNTPGDQLLTGLRGKDVLLTFVESYGRSAVEDPQFAPQVDALLDAGTQRLNAAGFASRSGFLTSPTYGGGSWLAHSTLLSGLWINNQQRYQNLVASNRLTLTRAFGRATWQTIAVVPGVYRAWPEASFFGYDRIYDSLHLGYHGPRFSWSNMPDQYTLSAFQRLEHGVAGHPPLMAEMPLTSSHAPWAPLPQMIGWNDVGDGSVYDPMPAAGRSPDVVWRDSTQVRTEYRRSIEYSLNSLISYVQTYGDKNLVLIFLGDHQPASIVTGEGASRDVPITIVAHDPAVLDRISGWGWTDGLKPSPQAPVWPMSAFRDRFLTAFGTQTTP